jgi:hypothetical protein
LCTVISQRPVRSQPPDAAGLVAEPPLPVRLITLAAPVPPEPPAGLLELADGLFPLEALAPALLLELLFMPVLVDAELAGLLDATGAVALLAGPRPPCAISP